jgi:DASS family divalent anion:Na+ symporter
MAPNPVVLAKSNELFPSIKFTFTTWLTGSIAPAMVCALSLPLILGPLILGRTLGAKQGYSDAIIAHSKQELKAMGSMSFKEMVKVQYIFIGMRRPLTLYILPQQLCLVSIGCLCLWVTSAYTKLDSTLVALMGTLALLLMGTITWTDIATNTTAVMYVK